MIKIIKVIKSALLSFLKPKDYLLLELLKENRKLKAELSNQKIKYKKLQSDWLDDKLYYKEQIKELRHKMRVPITAIKEFQLNSEVEAEMLRLAVDNKRLEYDTRNLSVITSDGTILYTVTVKPEIRKTFGCSMEQEKRYKKSGKTITGR